jgi:hypothetical protein
MKKEGRMMDVTDTVARIRSKNQSVEAGLQDWLSVALSTSHDDVAAAK